jgi:hypothetical protein
MYFKICQALHYSVEKACPMESARIDCTKIEKTGFKKIKLGRQSGSGEQLYVRFKQLTVLPPAGIKGISVIDG